MRAGLKWPTSSLQRLQRNNERRASASRYGWSAAPARRKVLAATSSRSLDHGRAWLRAQDETRELVSDVTTVGAGRVPQREI